GVVDRSVVGGHRVEVERATAVRLLPEGAGAVEARDGGDGAGFRVVPVVAVDRDAQALATDLVAGEDHAAAGLGRATDQAATVVGDAEDGRSVFQVTALDLGLAVAVTQLGAVEVLAQDDVDHAADGVGAVHRRSAVGQDLDALDRGQRDGVDVGARGGRHRVGRGATAVDQHEGTAGAEAAQV